MKKIVSLVLALALVLTAVSAFAAGSKQQPTPTTQDVTPEISISFIPDTSASATIIKAFKEAHDAGDDLKALPDDVRAKIGEGQTKISELLTAKFEGDLSKITGDMVLIVKFETPYKEGEKVTVLLGILNEPVEWHTFSGVGLKDGSVQITVPKDIFDKVQTDPFVIGVVGA